MEEQHDLAKWLEGKMTASELEAFEKSPDFETYQKIKQYSAELVGPQIHTEAMYQNIIAQPKQTTIPRVIKMKPNWMARVAAVAAILVLGFFIAKPLANQTQIAANGQQEVFFLPDHSEVTLNSGSEIRYNNWFWDGNRSLDLEGEAFFKVTKGKTFDVHTDLGTVTVVGTQFNVKARQQRFEVTCFEGKVKVANNSDKIYLTKGQSVIFENGKRMASVINTDSKPSWMNYQLTFNAENLNAVIAEIERQYDIVITKENIATSQKFTGTVPAGDMEMALQIISSAYNFKYQKTGKNSVTFKR
ncbi:FecR family protein [Flavobacterium sp.]|uniref:FecR family protein n=1 Tax=Flavobacterium sp. TaxID=239 RepID=UPI0039E34AA3